MFTFERFTPAFSNEEGRETFFRNAHHGVKPGTAMTHVLASNTGIWGNVDALKYDAAKIMICELDTYADQHGIDRLELPVEAIANSQSFTQAFEACRRFNAEEIEAEVTRLRAKANPGMKFQAPSERLSAEDNPDIIRYCSEAFLAELYGALCRVAGAYANEIEHHRRRLSRIGAI